jgi:CarD family transcriptional regulator
LRGPALKRQENPFTPLHNRWYINVEAVAFGRAHSGCEAKPMGIFDNIFGGKARRQREMDELMNPLLGCRLQHFVAFTADPSYVRHWFSFINKQGQTEEFITNFGVIDDHDSYIRTHWKKPGDEFFVTLSERGPWSIPITFLIELGKRLPVNTMAPETHPARNVSPGPQRHPDWKPPPDAAPKQAPPIRERNGFRVNEFVVYPAHGVGQILAIEEQEIAGAKVELFVINFMKDKMTLRVPTTKTDSIGMRKLSDPALADRALEALHGYPRGLTAPWQDQAKESESKINSGDIIALAEVVRDLYRPESRTGRPDGEQRLYEAALDRLAREIAIVRHWTEADAVREIERRLATSYAEKTSDGPVSSEGPRSATTAVNTPWEIRIGRYHEVCRTYEFTGLAPPNTYRKIEARCRLVAGDVRGVGRTVTPTVYLEISPRMMAQAGYLAAKFSPSDSESKFGGIAIKVEHTESGSNLLSVVPTDADQCIRALMAGRQITVRLMSPEGEFAAFPLENDASFAISYSRLLRLIETE